MVDSLSNHEHRGEGEMVVVNNLRKVFQLAAIDALVGPRQMVAGSNGRVLRILLQEFALDVVDNGG